MSRRPLTRRQVRNMIRHELDRRAEAQLAALPAVIAESGERARLAGFEAGIRRAVRRAYGQ